MYYNLLSGVALLQCVGVIANAYSLGVVHGTTLGPRSLLSAHPRHVRIRATPIWNVPSVGPTIHLPTKLSTCCQLLPAPHHRTNASSSVRST